MRGPTGSAEKLIPVINMGIIQIKFSQTQLASPKDFGVQPQNGNHIQKAVSLCLRDQSGLCCLVDSITTNQIVPFKDFLNTGTSYSLSSRYILPIY